MSRIPETHRDSERRGIGYGELPQLPISGAIRYMLREHYDWMLINDGRIDWPDFYASVNEIWIGLPQDVRQHEENEDWKNIPEGEKNSVTGKILNMINVFVEGYLKTRGILQRARGSQFVKGVSIESPDFIERADDSPNPFDALMSRAMDAILEDRKFDEQTHYNMIAIF